MHCIERFRWLDYHNNPGRYFPKKGYHRPTMLGNANNKSFHALRHRPNSQLKSAIEPSPGLSDTGGAEVLRRWGRSVIGFEWVRGLVAERLMQTLGIVERFNIFEHAPPRRFQVDEAFVLGPFVFNDQQKRSMTAWS
ncbi:MAG TPA: hypothetical protein VFE24_14875 [Pirellulales bacterium]|jgi:hypothetical protein|nr:hypothetical protein [Pirellulales bacterium]